MCDKELLIDYLYGELAAADREAFDRHLAGCADCRDEIAGLRGTRSKLESWAPPQPELGFHVVRGPQAAGATRWFGWSPAWGFAAAALLVGAVSAAIANVEVTTGAGGITIRTGWSAAAPVAQAQAMVPAAELKRVEARLRDLEAKLAGGPLLTPTAAPAPSESGRMSDADVVRMVRRMIEQSEERQQGAMYRQILQVNRDFDVARRADLDQQSRVIDQIRRSNIETFQATRRLEDFVTRVSVGLQR